jgi:uncharacterized damage-inducible protein DinB
MDRTTPRAEAGLDVLRDVFRHHAWATLQLIQYCATLPLDSLSQSVPGTRGPILETLRHIVIADYGYAKRFRVHSEPAVKELDLATVELMRTVFVQQAQTWQSLLERLPEFDITIAAEPWEDPPWPETPHAQNLLLIQAVHHGNEHRTQICTVLGSKGLEVPDLSCWAYWAAERIPR